MTGIRATIHIGKGGLAVEEALLDGAEGAPSGFLMETMDPHRVTP
jgi:hypothetical protein